jgi:hypothetical protein
MIKLAAIGGVTFVAFYTGIAQLILYSSATILLWFAAI